MVNNEEFLDNDEFYELKRIEILIAYAESANMQERRVSRQKAHVL